MTSRRIRRERPTAQNLLRRARERQAMQRLLFTFKDDHDEPCGLCLDPDHCDVCRFLAEEICTADAMHWTPTDV